MLVEFKKFIARGNVVDLAVGIIMGAAFTGIVNSLVKDIIMPPIGMITGGLDFSALYLNLSQTTYASLKEAQAAGAATVNYGIFLNQIINFLIVAFAVFMLVRQVNKLQAKMLVESQKAPAPAPTTSEVLLTEIRDLLKK